jgi:hypothetical protein
VLCTLLLQPPLGSIPQPKSGTAGEAMAVACAQRDASRPLSCTSNAGGSRGCLVVGRGAAEAAKGMKSEAASSREASFRRGWDIKGLLARHPRSGHTWPPGYLSLGVWCPPIEEIIPKNQLSLDFPS